MIACVLLMPLRDPDAGIQRCAVCDGYMRRFDRRTQTCADQACPGHVTGGCYTPEQQAADDLAMWEGWEARTGNQRPAWAPARRET